MLGVFSLQWRRNERDGVPYHWRLDCLLQRLFRRRSKKTSTLLLTDLCGGNPPVIGRFSSQRASNAENVSIWWHHHVQHIFQGMISTTNVWFGGLEQDCGNSLLMHRSYQSLALSHRLDYFKMIRHGNGLYMMTSWNGNIFRVTGLSCGDFIGHRWFPLTKASDAEIWCFLWSAPE